MLVDTVQATLNILTLLKAALVCLANELGVLSNCGLQIFEVVAEVNLEVWLVARALKDELEVASQVSLDAVKGARNATNLRFERARQLLGRLA